MDERALALLRHHGWVPGQVLGTGTEGTVVELSAGAVAKIWHDRSPAGLESLVKFGSAMELSPIPFRCSQAIEILADGEVTITIEQRVHGEQLRPDGVPDAPVVTDAEVRLMGDALAGLSTADSGGLSALPILPGEQQFPRARDFGASLAGLAERRFLAHPHQLRRSIDDVDELVGAVLAALRVLPEPDRPGLIHGDLSERTD